jgi:hypothetical protein
MSGEELLRQAFTSIDVDAAYAEATLWLSDGSRLVVCHRVEERWAKAVAGAQAPGVADQILALIHRFRLNAKHLDVEFRDGSRWELKFAGRK